MHTGRCRRGFVAFLPAAAIAAALLAPGVAGAQAISGTVTDATGAVLPGVTVEARSPSLIEQVRTTVTDGTGQYQVVALEPGTYSVTYTLIGFGTLVREGIVLTTGFTANVDVQLAVGDIEETVTVSGATPVVDIQNVDQRQVMDRQVIDSVPTGKSFQSYALLVPGMAGSAPFGTNLNQDSGGQVAQSYQAIAIHGGDFNDQITAINGLDVSDANTRGRMYGLISDGDFEEMAIEYSSHSAEVETGGVRVNLIPREGSNRFSGAMFGTFSHPNLQADNVDDDLVSRGVLGGQEIDEVWLVNPSFGGPIAEDRLWFFIGHTTQRANFFAPNTFHSRDPAALTYVADESRPALDVTDTYDQSLNLTWQATSKDKVKGYYSHAYFLKPNGLQGAVLGSLFVAPDGTADASTRINTVQLGWVRPQTNRLLFEASGSVHRNHQDVRHHREAVPDLPGVTNLPDLTINRNLAGWSQGGPYMSYRTTSAFRGSMSYVTGSHNLKVGVNGTYIANDRADHNSHSDWVDIITFLGNPILANYRLPNISQNRGLAFGIYVQEQWTLDRLTLNAGLRYDRVDNWYPDQSRKATIWEPDGRSIIGEPVVGWNDMQPRVGVAYDLFGTGRTALKAAVNRYGARENAYWAEQVNPIRTNRLERRTWNDRTCIGDPGGCVLGDGIPQGNPLAPGANGELLSPRNNPNFGQPAITTFLDQAWAYGWGHRYSNWEISAGVQQELMPGMSLDVSYFRRAYVNFNVQDDRALAAGDYDVFTVDLSDRGLLGGVDALTLWEINPAAFGRSADVLLTSAGPHGGEQRRFNGVDITVDARQERLLLQGGLSTGKTSIDYCGLWSSVPEHLAARADMLYDTDMVPREYCNASTVWLTQVKFLGSYTLPYDIQLAGTFQSQPGPERFGIVAIPAAEIEAALGRPQALPGAVTVNAVRPGTQYGERFNQFDLRLTKILGVGGDTRLRVMVDLFNLFNANAVVKEQYGVGDDYLVPLGFMPGRLLKFTFQLDF